MTPLFASLRVGAMSLPNRVVMAPMTRSRADADHIPTDIMAPYYASRAAGGLLITEGTAPDANGAGYPRIPGLWNSAQIDAWRKVTDAVHAKGGRIAVQLMHTGRIGHPSNLPEGAEILGPAADVAPGEMYTDQAGMQAHPAPRAMNEADIEVAIAGFVKAAENAMAAGFDAVEIHGANGYLIDQFLTPSVNTRTDAWGGNAEGRARFAFEVSRRVAAAIGPDRVGIRLSPYGVFNSIEPWDDMEADFVALARRLGALGLAYLHVVDMSSMGAVPVPREVKVALKRAFDGTFILSGGYDDRASAEEDLAAGLGDLGAFGRPYLANPDLVRRLKEDAPLNSPDHDTFYTPGEAGYLDYSTLDG